MTAAGHKPRKSRLREKAARAPRPHFGRAQDSIAQYLADVRPLNSEPARLARFTGLLNDLFGELDFPLVRDFLAGFETKISTHQAEKCRVLRGRPDALYGNLVIEFERGATGWLRDARRQLELYSTILTREANSKGSYFIPIASDGIRFVVFAPKEGSGLPGEAEEGSVELEQVEEFDLSKRQPSEFYYWLDRYFLRQHKREPRAENFLQDFGTDSAAFRLASARWLGVAEQIREQSDFRVIYENWRQYLRIAYGTAIGDVSLFIRHTFLATLAKLIAYIRITDAKAPPEEGETQEIIEGKFFERQGILNFLEEDFFSWAAREPALGVTQQIAARLANLLFTYHIRELSEDVLKELYQELVGKEDRHGLGEYYTPDWLAARMCEALLSKSGEDFVLDPACGSGTFLYQTIQHKKRHLPATRQSLEKVLGAVVGIDIHPLAVIVSKMNVLLALGDLFSKRAGPVSIQVYLANSIRHPEKVAFIGNGGVACERVVLNKREVLIPDAALADAARLDAAARVADEFAKSNRESPKLDFEAFANFAKRESPILAESGDVLRVLFELAALLHEFIRKPEDTIWAYILKNQYKPTFLTQKFDVVIGNPPWLSFRYVERGEYQDFLKQLIVKDCGLLENAGHLITHLELGTLFFVRCASLYLKPTGKIGFVLPRSIFTADQHDNFRRSSTRGNVTLTGVWDLEDVRPLFNVPAAVAFADLKSDTQKTLPGRIFSGELQRKNASWAEAKADLTIQSTEFHVIQQGKRTFLSTSRKKISACRSYYQPFFKEGATIVPRNFWFVEIKSNPKLGADPTRPLLATDPRAEAEAKQPYKGTHFEDSIEAEFLYATLLSTDLLPFGHFDFRPVVLPLVEDAQGYQLLDAERARAKGFLKLAAWIERAEATWRECRKEKAKRGSALQWLNYRNKLTDQDPKAEYVVLYPMSATYLCAAAVARSESAFGSGEQAVRARGVVADYVSFYFETNSRGEARYIVAVLNSPAVDRTMKPMQAKGLWGPRHICKKVLELPIPQFDEGDKRHARLAEIAEACEHKARDMTPDLKKLFEDTRGPHAIGRARTAVRQALASELEEIDGLVHDILK